MKGDMKKSHAARLPLAFLFALLLACGAPRAAHAAAKDISGCRVTLSQTKFVYSGERHSPGVTVTDGEAVLRAGFDYSVYGGGASSVGVHEVVVAGMGDYAGQASAFWEIIKAPNEISLESPDTILTYSGPAEKDVWCGAKGKAKLHFSTATKGVSITDGGTLSIQDGFLGAAAIHVTSEETESHLASSADFTVQIRLRGTSITGFTDGGVIGLADNDHTVRVEWSTGLSGIQSVGGFQIRYSKDPAFQSGVRMSEIPMLKALGGVVNGCSISKGLKKGDRVHFQIRTYKKALDGNMHYSDWSGTETHDIDSSPESYYKGKKPKNGKVYQFFEGKSEGVGIRYRYQNGALSVAGKQEVYSQPAKVVIPDSVSVYGKKYPVTSIEKGAFRGKWIRSIVIGKNVKKIGANAFAGVYRTKKITIKSKRLTAKTVSKNAFKDFNHEAGVFMGRPYEYSWSVKLAAPKSMKVKYRRLLEKSGVRYGIK